MKPIPSIRITAASLCAAVLACAQPAVAADNAALVASNHAFACDLYGQLRAQPGNVFLSPYSISTALAMTYGGARGETATQMAKTLHFEKQGEALHQGFAGLQGGLNAIQQKGDLKLAIANSLWPQQGYAFLPAYTQLCQTHYQATPTPVDFASHTEEARVTINHWVEEKTNDKIKNLFPSGALDANTRLALVNAIYFKGNWAEKFDPQQTQKAAFHLADGKTSQAELMHATHRVLYAETPELQVIGLPYAGDALSMLVFLPRKADGLAALEAKLSARNLGEWSKSLRQKEVSYWLPKFKMTSQFALGSTLAKMGMADAFDAAKADFSGMNGKRDLFIGAVVHKAFIEVNEEGTEAAAATGIGFGVTSIPAEPPVFRADHPFLFAIRDNKSGSLLFLGRVANPAAP